PRERQQNAVGTEPLDELQVLLLEARERVAERPRGLRGLGLGRAEALGLGPGPMLGLPGRRELLAQRADLALERIDAEPRRRLADDERGLDPALFAARRANAGVMGRALQHLETSAARQVVDRPVARVRRGVQAEL